jgi:hypothetical protein
MKPIGGLNFFKKFIFYLINRRRASGSQLITFHIRHDEKKKKKSWEVIWFVLTMSRCLCSLDCTAALLPPPSLGEFNIHKERERSEV